VYHGGQQVHILHAEAVEEGLRQEDNALFSGLLHLGSVVIGQGLVDQDH
jgi:hypothetical protein